MVAKILNRISWIQKTIQDKEQVLLLRGEEIGAVQLALQKQKKIKPVIDEEHAEDYSISWMCPDCKSYHSASYCMQFCSSCGQAIDWS